MDITTYAERLKSYLKRFDWAIIIKYILIAVFTIIAIIFVFGFFFESCGNYMFNRDVNKRKQNVNQLLINANSVKENLEDLKIEQKLKEQEVNAQRNVYVNSMEVTNIQRNTTNERLLNINAIQSANYSNKTLEDALKARCKAFPERCK